MAWYHSTMVAFTLPGGIPVYLFSLLLAVGSFIGLLRSATHAPDGAELRRLEAGIWALAGGLIGGRAAHVALAWPYYQNNLGEAIQVSLGGLAWQGALAGGCLALLIFSALNRQPFGALADALIPLPAALAVAGWLGCLVEGCGYGAPNEYIGIASPDEWGVVARRLPVQIVSALLCLLAFFMIDRLPDSLNELYGLRACLMVLALAAIQFGATLLVEPANTWRGLPLDAWSSLAFAGVALMGLGAAVRSGRTRQ